MLEFRVGRQALRRASDLSGLALLAGSLLASGAAGQQFGVEQVVSADLSGVWTVFAADLDGDGDQDVLAQSYGDDQVLWFENVGPPLPSVSADTAKLGLTQKYPDEGRFGPARVVTDKADGVVAVTAADLDGDGDQDVVSGSILDDKLAWYENTDGLGTFRAHTITTAAADPMAIVPVDLDGDGDMDLVVAQRAADNITWYENTDGLGTFGPGQFVTSTDIGLTVCTADLDGDGDQDVISASLGALEEVRWSENLDGLGTSWQQHVVSTVLVDSVLEVSTGDLDGDGDQDVLTSVWDDCVVAWYENLDGLGTFGAARVLDFDMCGAESARAVDLDLDGDQDVVAVSYDDQVTRFVWFENLDGAGNFGGKHLLNYNEIAAPNYLHIADFDGDGVPDVLVGGGGYYPEPSRVVWHANLHELVTPGGGTGKPR